MSKKRFSSDANCVTGQLYNARN